MRTVSVGWSLRKPMDRGSSDAEMKQFPVNADRRVPSRGGAPSGGLENPSSFAGRSGATCMTSRAHGMVLNTPE